MARRRPPVVDVARGTEEDAEMRARHAWMLGRFGTVDWAPFVGWCWPSSYEDADPVDLLARVSADYASAGIELPIGGYVGERDVRA